MIMVFEGLMDEAPEDVTTFVVTEPTHTDEDEAYYCEWIASGLIEEVEEFEDERDFPGDYFTQSEMDHFADLEADRWERNFWGD